MDQERPPQNRVDRAFEVMRLDGSAELTNAARLVSERYGWRGYETDQSASFSGSTALGAVGPTGELLGTLAVRLDGAKGLACARTYADVISAHRGNGDVLAEICALAMTPTRQFRQVFAALFHYAYVYSVLRGVNRVFIEVNPRHVEFYERSCRFSVAAGERHCERASAPAVLLTVTYDEVSQGIQAFGGRGVGTPGAGHLIYPYFFAPSEELQIVRRLLKLEGIGHEYVFGGRALDAAPVVGAA